MAIQIDIPQKDCVTNVLVTDDGRTFVAASGSVESASDARNLYAAIVQEPSTLNPQMPLAGLTPLIIPPEETGWSFGTGSFLPDACCGSAPTYCRNYIGVWVELAGGGYEFKKQRFFGRCQKD